MKFIIADVHGCFDTLMALLEKLPPEANSSNIIFLGDLVDRGPKNRDVINFVKDGGYDCVQGNHEELMIDAVDNYIEYDTPLSWGNWSSNGGNKTFMEYSGYTEAEDDIDGLIKDAEWMKTLPRLLIYEKELDERDRKLIISHAPCLDYLRHYLEYLEEDPDGIQTGHHEMLLIWNRTVPKQNQKEYFNVTGHNIIDNFIYDRDGKLLIDEKVITPENIVLDMDKGFAAIDNGAFIENDKSPYRGKLTCLEYPSMKVYQQDNIGRI